MGFSLSPSVNVTEKDLSLYIPNVAVSIGATVGFAEWGPVEEVNTVSSEKTFVGIFGQPNDSNFKDWYTAYNFLAYSSNLKFVRVVDDAVALNSAAGITDNATENQTDFVFNNSIETQTDFVLDNTITSPTDLTFANATSDITTAGGVDWTTVGFASGDTIVITGTASNNGTFTVNGAPTSTVLTVNETITDEGTADASATIQSNTITTTAGDFSTAGLADGATIVLSGTTNNEGTYLINATVTTTVISVAETLVDETPAVSCTVQSNTITTTAGDFVTAGFVQGSTIIVVSGTTNNNGNYLINATPTTTVLSVAETVVDETPGIAVLITQWIGTFDATNSTGHLIKNSIDRDASEVTINATTNAIIAKYPGIYANDLAVSIADATSAPLVNWPGAVAWKYTDFFNVDPVDSEIYVVVTYKGDVVEIFEADKDPASVNNVTGGTNYVKEIVNRQSQYIWCIAENLYGGNATDGYTVVQFEGDLSGGLDGYADTAASDDERQTGWDLLTDAETLDINLCMIGGGSAIAGKYMIENVCEWRKDCVGFVSPMSEDVVGNLTPVTAIVVTRELFGSSSYGFMDGNYKYQYDAYNDTFHWVPFNGDMAGLCAYTDEIEDPWWSPAGLNRGGVKNVTKLAFDPTKTNRDNLYRRAVNPVVTFRGEGTVLFGDKTLQTKPSAFDRINVRRLFIVIEKAIATASKYALFEFNDTVTRQAFVSLVEPYLRDVKARRGIFDFKVVCDETNNTPIVIDRNEFIGDIYVKPTRSINFIYLNFVAVPTGIEFEEVLLNQG